MKKQILPIILFLLLLTGLGESAAPRISFWTSTYFTSADFSNFLPLSGHTTEGDSPSNQVNVSIMPAGTFTLLTLLTNDPGSPGWTNTATLYRNGLATSASCTIPNGSFSCSWTGVVAFAEGDLANIKMIGGGGILIKGPWCVMTVFTLGGRDWPFTS
jgi:hypothetical protein